MAHAPPLHNRRVHPWRETARWAQAVMALCWLVPWYRAMTPGTHAAGQGETFFLFLGITQGAHYLARGMHALRLRLRVRRVLLVLWMGASALCVFWLLLYAHLSASWEALFTRPVRAFADVQAVLPDELFAIGIVVLLTWRGALTAEQHIGPRAFVGSFRLGVVMFLLFSLVNTLVTGETPGVLLFVFLFAALAGMASARLAVMGALRGGRHSAFDRGWVLAMTLAALVTSALALWATRWADSGFALALGRVAAGVGIGLLALLTLVLLPVVMAIVWLLLQALALLRVDSWLPQAFRHLEDLFRALAEWGAQVSGLLRGLLPDPRLMKPLLLWALVAGMVALALSWLGWQVARQRQTDVEEAHRAQWEISGVWRFLWQRWQTRARLLVLQVARLPLGRRNLLRAERIRQVYAEFVRACALQGVPRPLATTPLEFITLTEELLPALQGEVRLLTEAYLRVRYGKLPESDAEVAAVEHAWMLVKQALHAKKPAG